MIGVDVNKVRGKMAEKGFTISSLSKSLGINRNTLTSYFDTPEKMPYGIVSGLADTLFDDLNEASRILFCEELTQNERIDRR